MTRGIPYFKAWLIFTIISVLLAAFVGFASGAILGTAMGVAGVPVERIQAVCGIVGFLLGLIVSFTIFRWVIDKYIVAAIAAMLQSAETESSS